MLWMTCCLCVLRFADAVLQAHAVYDRLNERCQLKLGTLDSVTGEYAVSDDVQPVINHSNQ